MKIPPDLDNPDSTIDPTLDPSLSLKGGGKGGRSFLLVAIAAVLGIVGYFGYGAMKRQDERKLHAGFMQGFADIEKNEVVGKFWSCVLGPNIDPGLFKDNLGLSQRVESMFATDPKTFPSKVREDCTPKAIDARHKIESLSAPPIYQEALKKYEVSLSDLASSFDEWAKTAPAQMADREVGRKVGIDGAAWHSFAGGKPAPEVIAYDRFLHCAVPTVDSMKDGQALVEYLFNQCKNPAYVARIDGECGKEVTTEIVGAPTKGMTTALKKLQADDRELSAFDDCLRKLRKGKRTDDLAAVGKAWVAYMEAGHAVRKIGADALKD